MTLVKVIAIAAVAYVTAAAIWGDRVTGLIYTARYQGFVAVPAVLALAMVVEAMTVPLRILLRVTHRPRTEFHGVALALIVGLVLSMYLIPAFGILGASFALVAAKLTTFFVDLAVVRYGRGSNYPPPQAARAER